MAGQLSPAAKRIMEALTEHSPQVTAELKLSSAMSNPKKRTEFDRAMAELQMKMYVVKIAEFYDPFTFLWELTTLRFNEEINLAQQLSLDEARQKILQQYFRLLWVSDATACSRLFSWPAGMIQTHLQRLLENGFLDMLFIHNEKKTAIRLEIVMSREMKQVVHKTRQNILVTRLRFMGDIILTTPVLQNLRRAFPDAHIGYLAEAPFQQMLQPHPWVDSVFALDRQKGSLQFKLIRELRRRKWDVAIDLFGNPRSALLTFLSGAAMRIGGDFRGRRHYYTHRVGDDDRPKSAIQFHLNYLQPLGMETLAVDPHIHVTGAENQQAREHLAGLGYDLHKPIVGLHCGATWPAKKWFPDRFAQLAQTPASAGWHADLSDHRSGRRGTGEPSASTKRFGDE